MVENYREIPYNYTSFSDKEIILRYFNEEYWSILQKLRQERVTGRSAKLLFEIIGDLFMLDRNPYVYEHFHENKTKRLKLKKKHKNRFKAIEEHSKQKSVLFLLEETKKLHKQFFSSFSKYKKRQNKIIYHLKKNTRKENIEFSAFHKVSHVTDATDLRVEFPEVIVYPSSKEEIVKIIQTAKRIDLKIIPRGGGTGLTGGAVPIYKNTLIVNTEKLRKINEIEFVQTKDKKIPVVEVESGVITEVVTQFCKKKDYVFATDPTSSWASTIGGNIAENAGGKKAVLWGTTIDNIFSFQIVNANSEIFEVERRNHPHRKILESDEVIFDVYRIHEKLGRKKIKSIELKGTDIRKKGIGKDITNKALKGVYGIQKEGGDGIILSAKFVLYKPYRFKQTVCLEFFGSNLINASKAIVEIRNHFESHVNIENESVLTALEHFDDKYAKAIGYKNKSNRGELPKAVLLIDVEANEEKSVDGGCNKILEIVKPYNTEGFIAKTELERVSFWKDRKNLGAIAKHTNAFKLNEDVVIPIESLPLFADYIEKLNIQKEISNNLEIIEEIKVALQSLKSQEDYKSSFFEQKKNTFLKSLIYYKFIYKIFLQNIEKNVIKVIQFINNKNYNCLDCKDKNFVEAIKKIKEISSSSQDSKMSLFEAIRDNIISIQIKDLEEIFQNHFHGYEKLLQQIQIIIDNRKDKQIIIATHMHAGDGNVHVNIPVHSNDYSMMQKAEETAGDIMKKTVELNGVISGEHGIGLTKLNYIDKTILDEYQEYKKTVDPEHLFNPSKLDKNFNTKKMYTPSLNLLEKEAYILETADLKDLTTMISPCVRCGKCKEVCNTHSPQENILYNPRNKILATSLITEAFLYEAQTENKQDFRNFKTLREVSDHCTICHNCFNPCPVNIDTGKVTLAIRELLVERKRKKFKFVTWMTLYYLRRRGYYINKFFRILLLKIGYTSQRIAYYLNKPIHSLTKKVFPYVSAILKSKLPKAGKKTFREILGLRSSDAFFSFQRPKVDIVKSVFYFPGCGSERMFSDISIAVIAMLYNANVRVVIAPDYLCCGYPLLANGKTKLAKIKSFENRVLFQRIAETASYMNIQNVIVSCGTCYEMLEDYHLENIFTDGQIIDINEFFVQENLYQEQKKNNEQLFYHKPCHSPMKKYGAEKSFDSLLGCQVNVVENCCGEGGTLALSTPNLSNSIRDRKTRNFKNSFCEAKIQVDGFIDKKKNSSIDKNNLTNYTSVKKGRKSKIEKKKTVLTTCPSCVQGVSKVNHIEGKSLVVYLAEKTFGKNWKNGFIELLEKENGIEKIVL